MMYGNILGRERRRSGEVFTFFLLLLLLWSTQWRSHKQSREWHLRDQASITSTVSGPIVTEDQNHGQRG